MSNTMSKGFDRETTEEAIDLLIQNGVIEEPRFGWFIMIHGQ